MTQQIDFSANVVFGDSKIDSITVSPVSFSAFSAIWATAGLLKNSQVELQRARIRKQVSFMSTGKEITPTDADIMAMPASVAKMIIAQLDAGYGVPGDVITEGDGVTTAIVYKLGAPIKIKSKKEGSTEITELEFLASTFGELEQVYAADGEIAKTVELITRVAVPIGVSSLTTMPGWAVDKISTSDGFQILRDVLPNF